ncbi:HdeD family acid-resistance protein [Roseitranquillus sediminis]|uniref:HdeD family acid-resistance protein n=1 Tax=Roseitranquillus sediminis TaxID=2809051 RepID=UPI001D0C0742|nr:DUF308 domain-containing protein [Roseitranquillus sediminis]MBM9593503.1 DUF308 domain-containing protein [Roseitranquillus sediminis]
MSHVTEPEKAPPPPSRFDWLLTLLMGLVLILGGFMALANPFAATLTVTVVASAAFVVAGAMQLWLAFRGGETGARAVAAALGVLLILFAVSLVAQPFAGILSLTILVAAFFLAAGLVRIWLASRRRESSGWGWLLASGLVSAALGLIIFFALPEGSLVLLGIFLGVELLASGAAAVALALAARSG